jgi:hypothetical protein
MSYRNARITFLHRVSILIPAPQQWHLPVLHCYILIPLEEAMTYKVSLYPSSTQLIPLEESSLPGLHPEMCVAVPLEARCAAVFGINFIDDSTGTKLGRTSGDVRSIVFGCS